MHIEDHGIIVNKTKWSESSAIVWILSENHGLIKGLAKGGLKSNHKINLELGNKVKFKKSSRTESNLGVLSVELLKLSFINSISSRFKSLAIVLVCQMISEYLSENTKVKDLYDATFDFLDLMFNLQSEVSSAKRSYVTWELKLLKAVGYGLDLSKCAVTSEVTNLKYISPKTGRAVTEQVGLLYKDKLLRLPELMCNINNLDYNELDYLQDIQQQYQDCFYVLSYFFNKYNTEYSKNIPILRDELIKLY